MGKTKDKPGLAAEVLRPYVKRALDDPELRDDLLAAFVAARGLYGQLAEGRGVRAKATAISDRDFQSRLQELVTELSDASDRLQGKGERKGHKFRNRVVFLTGVTLGVLYNPWTGAATREWILEHVVSGDGSGLEALADELDAEGEATAGNGSEPAGS